MKITPFDELWPNREGVGGAVSVYASGSNSADGDTSGGGDVVGEPGAYSVVGLRSMVSLASNIGGGTVGDVLTIIQASPRLAAFATPSNSGVSFGSNATRVSEVASGGVSTSAARADHIHDGIGTVTASSSNTMQRGTLNLRAGSNVTFGLTDGDGDGEFDTLTVGLVQLLLDSLADVTITSAASNQRLRYDGAGQWRNSSLIWRPVMTYDGTNWLVAVDGSGNAILTEA